MFMDRLGRVYETVHDAALLIDRIETERDEALARAQTAEAEAARWRGIALHTAEEAARMRAVSVTHRTGA